MTAVALFPERHAQDHWTKLAACLNLPRHWWFPELGDQGYERARAICKECPVRVSCLVQGIKQESPEATRAERHGMWGGTTPAQRHMIAHQLRAEPLEAWAPVAVDILDRLLGPRTRP